MALLSKYKPKPKPTDTGTGVLKLKHLKIKPALQQPKPMPPQLMQINLSDTIEITEVTTTNLCVQPKWQADEEDECKKEDDEFAPIMCDDEGPDFSLFKSKKSDGEELGGKQSSSKKRNIDPSSMQSFARIDNIDLRKGFAIDLRKKRGPEGR
jgi:hypothetical protein